MERTYAVVDLGSNSFHAQLAHVIPGASPRISVIDRTRASVQLAAGLRRDGTLSDAAQRRGLRVLRHFGDVLRKWQPHAVRVVATNTLRVASNRADFVRLGTALIGHPIEVIPGIEEAHLIYRGVAYAVPLRAQQRRLVLDIGGGSTECAVGDGHAIHLAESRPVGCVTMSRQRFPRGLITPGHLRTAIEVASQAMADVAPRVRALGFDEAIGSSGTIQSAGAMLSAAGVTDGTVTPSGLAELEDALCRAGRVASLALPGLRPDRANVLAGGLAVLRAAFDTLGIQELRVSPGALREGVLLELHARAAH